MQLTNGVYGILGRYYFANNANIWFWTLMGNEKTRGFEVILTGVPTNKSISSKSADVKYRISFKQLVTRKPLIWDSYLFVTYTQKAFWDIYQESSPFKEINFNPSIVLGKVFYKNNQPIAVGTFGMEHESNGRDSIFSRSWNNFNISYHTKIGRTTQASLKVWIPFVYKVGNPDLFDYLGFYELNVYQDLWSDKWNFELMARKGLQFNWKGAIRSRLYYRPFKKNNQGFMLEWFNGYSESLINYKEYKSVIRIGYVIKTNEFNIFN